MAQKPNEDWSGIINYLNSIASSIRDVEIQSKIALNEINQSIIFFDRSTHKIQTDLEHLKKGISTAKKVIENQKNIVKLYVKEFKGIGKSDQFNRLKDKAEDWNPERFITRKEFKEKR